MKVASYIAVVAVLVGAGAGSAAAQASSETGSTPKDTSSKDTSSKGAASGAALSPELIAQGDKIFHGAGNCYACHGTNAQGSVGPNLTDAEWIHSNIKPHLSIVAAQISGVNERRAITIQLRYKSIAWFREEVISSTAKHRLDCVGGWEIC